MNFSILEETFIAFSEQYLLNLSKVSSSTVIVMRFFKPHNPNYVFIHILSYKAILILF